MAPPQGGVFDSEHKLLNWLDGLYREKVRFPVEPGPPQDRVSCFVSLSPA
jgi:hypothetical protein